MTCKCKWNTRVLGDGCSTCNPSYAKETMTPREEAIADMKYAKSLGETALKQHYTIWCSAEAKSPSVVHSSYDAEYACVMMEIYDKLNTNECLLFK